MCLGKEDKMGKGRENLIRCPICDKGTLVSRQGEFVTEVKCGTAKKELRVGNISWDECDACGEKIFDDVAMRQISDARYEAIGLLTPSELKEIRKKLGYTQEQVAAFLGIGNKTYCRWENGTSIQTKSMDTLIRCATRDKLSELQKGERVRQAVDYLARLKEKRLDGLEETEMRFAAHSKDASSSEIKKLGLKLFGRKDK
jgi:putative zinc finger/helix-turn-helix YgiT family protein